MLAHARPAYLVLTTLVTHKDRDVDRVIRFVGDSPLPIWFLTGRERLARAFTQLGLTDGAPWPTPVPEGRDVLLVRADYAFDGAAIKGLATMPKGVLIDPASGTPVAILTEATQATEMARLLAAPAPSIPNGLAVFSPADLPSRHDRALRKRGAGYIAPITGAAKNRIEHALFGAAYKDVTDLVTKYVWPRPAFYVTKLCAFLGLSPNAVTLVGALLVVAAAWLFSQGAFGPGLVAAWVMTFLDTVDGKLARVTMTSSKLGGALDHGIDLIHPPIWYWAWLVGLTAANKSLPYFDLVALVIIGGYVVQRLQEGLFLLVFHMEIHVWRRFDSFFRLITARRNPNLIILTVSAIFGRPDIGIMGVAVWTALSLAIHTVQIGQAAFARARGMELRSWLSP